MNTRSFVKLRRPFEALVLLAAVSGLSCSDDNPTSPPTPGGEWVEVMLPAELPEGMLRGIGFTGQRGLAIHLEAAADGYRLLQKIGGGSWMVAAAASSSLALPLALDFDASGRAMLAGVDTAGAAMVVAERPDWMPMTLPPLESALQAMACASDGFVHAAGRTSGSLIGVRGTIDGDWTSEVYPSSPASAEKGVADLAGGARSLWACGWDDGAEGTEASPHALVWENTGSGWTRVDSPCGGCSGHEFRAVAIPDEGSLLLGGAITAFSPSSGDSSLAFLYLRPPSPSSVNWPEAKLPRPADLRRVNDILVTSNGDIYLACGDSTAFLVWMPSTGGVVIEYEETGLRLNALSEAADGTIYAVGGRDDGSTSTAVMLRREEFAHR